MGKGSGQACEKDVKNKLKVGFERRSLIMATRVFHYM